MLFYKKLFIVFIIFLFFSKKDLSSKQIFSKQYENLPRIVIMTISSFNNIHSISDPEHQYIPNFWNKMKKHGTLYTNVVDKNYQFHMPVVKAINTGINYPFRAPSANPTIFQYLRKKYKLPKYKLWSIGSWLEEDIQKKTPSFDEDTFPSALHMLNLSFKISDELKEFASELELDFEKRYRKLTKITTWSNWDSVGAILSQLSIKIFSNFKPILVHYILNEPETAHYDTFARYVLSIKKIDTVYFNLWNFFQTNKFYQGKTYFFLVPDHERNRYYASHHDRNFTNPSKLWFFVYGPNIRKNFTIKHPVKHIDIFATLSFIYGLKTHSSSGKILKDCFINFAEAKNNEVFNGN